MKISNASKKWHLETLHRRINNLSVWSPFSYETRQLSTNTLQDAATPRLPRIMTLNFDLKRYKVFF